MAKHRHRPAGKRLVWRISEAVPLGEFVDANAATTAPTPARVPDATRPESAASGGWIVSSFELLSGIDMTESAEPLADDVFAELFPDVSAAEPPAGGDVN